MHIHSQTRTYTCTGKSDKTGIIEYGIKTHRLWMTELCRFVWTDLAALSLYVLSGLALGFPAGPLLLYTGYPIKALTLWKPGYASKYHLFTSCMHTTHTDTPTTKHTNVLDKVLTSIIIIWKRLGGGGVQILILSIVTVLNVKPYFCIFCNFLTSALSGTCCYKSNVGPFLQSQKQWQGRGGEGCTAWLYSEPPTIYYKQRQYGICCQFCMLHCMLVCIVKLLEQFILGMPVQPPQVMNT